METWKLLPLPPSFLSRSLSAALIHVQSNHFSEDTHLWNNFSLLNLFVGYYLTFFPASRELNWVNLGSLKHSSVLFSCWAPWKEICDLFWVKEFNLSSYIWLSFLLYTVLHLTSRLCPSVWTRIIYVNPPLGIPHDFAPYYSHQVLHTLTSHWWARVLESLRWMQNIWSYRSTCLSIHTAAADGLTADVASRQERWGGITQVNRMKEVVEN